MLKVFVFYLLISFCVLMINLLRWSRCSFLHKKYQQNILNENLKANWKIKHHVQRLFDKSNSLQYIIGYKEPLINPWCVEKVNTAFANSEQFYLFNASRCLLWFVTAVESLTFYAGVRRVKPKILKFLAAIIQTFAAYLLGLFLDTTGIGNKVVDTLLSLVTK